MKIFRKIIIIIAILLVVLSLYFSTLHYRREPFIYSTAALEYFIEAEKRLPNNANELLSVYNNEFTPLLTRDVRMINWHIDWNKIEKRDNKLFDDKGERVYIIYPKAFDPLLRWEAQKMSISLFDVYQNIKKN